MLLLLIEGFRRGLIKCRWDLLRLLMRLGYDHGVAADQGHHHLFIIVMLRWILRIRSRGDLLLGVKYCFADVHQALRRF